MYIYVYNPYYLYNQINIFMSFHQLKHPHHVLINLPICIFWRVLDMKGFQIFGDPPGIPAVPQSLPWTSTSERQHSARSDRSVGLDGFETWIVTWWSYVCYVKLHLTSMWRHNRSSLSWKPSLHTGELLCQLEDTKHPKSEIGPTWLGTSWHRVTCGKSPFQG